MPCRSRSSCGSGSLSPSVGNVPSFGAVVYSCTVGSGSGEPGHLVPSHSVRRIESPVPLSTDEV